MSFESTSVSSLATSYTTLSSQYTLPDSDDDTNASDDYDKGYSDALIELLDIKHDGHDSGKFCQRQSNHLAYHPLGGYLFLYIEFDPEIQIILDMAQCDDVFQGKLFEFLLDCQSEPPPVRAPCNYICDLGFSIRSNSDNGTMSIFNSVAHEVIKASDNRLPAKLLVSYSGPLGAKLALFCHYAPLKSQTPDFGESMAFDNTCMDVLGVKTGKNPDIMVADSYIARVQRPPQIDGQESLDYNQPYVKQHGLGPTIASRDGLHKLACQSNAKIIVLVGRTAYETMRDRVRNQHHISLHDFDLFGGKSHMFAEMTSNTGQAQQIVRLYIPVYHPEYLLRGNMTSAQALAMDRVFNFACKATGIQGFLPNYFQQYVRKISTSGKSSGGSFGHFVTARELYKTMTIY